VWTGRQALARGLVDQLGGLRDAVAEAATLAKLGKDYPVRYEEAPLGGFERFLVGLNHSASMHLLQSWGVRLPRWFAQLPALAPELELLRNAKAGTPNIYADCLCVPR
jgi:protease-4